MRLLKPTCSFSFFGVIFLASVVDRAETNVLSPPDRPNIVLILADDLGYGDVACYNTKLPEDAGEDSVSLLPLLTGRQAESEPLRTYTLQESIRGFSVRFGPWKYLDHRGSGGNNYEVDGHWGAKAFALPDSLREAPGQLYHLERDPGEWQNLYFEHPEMVERLKKELQRMKQTGRSVPWPRSRSARPASERR